ncbi:hypothetical protein DAMA08_028780 [Martiniozyma asiatica (nom. inval.)]|nr:hypothetical protein DAMA08_028780 [Martiniozyma asiatica]
MRVSPMLSGELQTNDDNIRLRNIQMLRTFNSNEFKLLCYTIHFLCYLQDESIVVLLLKGFIQLFVNHKLGINDIEKLRLNQQQRADPTSLRSLNDVRSETHRALFTGFMNKPTNTEEEDMSIVRRKMLIFRMMNSIIVVNILVIIYQYVFCCGANTVYENFNYGLFGSYIIGKWNTKDAFTMGGALMSLIGESKARVWWMKFGYIFLFDILGLCGQLMLLIFNVAIELHVMEDIVTENENDETTRVFDGLQGNMLLYRIRPTQLLSLFNNSQNEDLSSAYYGEVGPGRSRRPLFGIV